MELREYAERILFATSLEEKLQLTAEVTDERPGPALITPVAPGRPKELHFKATGEARDSFPGTKNLEQASERGKLLHFFANHELFVMTQHSKENEKLIYPKKVRLSYF